MRMLGDLTGDRSHQQPGESACPGPWSLPRAGRLP